MTQKIILSFSVLLILSCSSTKSNKDSLSSNKTVNITVYSGVLSTNDSCFNGASSAVKIGNKILVADTWNNLIRKIENNKISTYVGNGQKENKEGQGIYASLDSPENIVIDNHKNAYTSVNYDQIFQIDSLGNATLFSGRHIRGTIDGEGGEDGSISEASFKFISAMAINPNDEIFVADKHKIRKIANNGTVTTIAGSKQQGDKIGKAGDALFNQIADIALNKKQELYIVDQVNKKIKKLSPDGIVSTFIPEGIFNWPSSIAVDSKGMVIVFDSGTKKINVFDQQGKLFKTIENDLLMKQDYYFQVKIKVDDKDNIILPSKDIVNIIDKDYTITQYGSKKGTCRNGNIKTATYYSPFDGVFDKQGNLYVLDSGNNLIRKISKEGSVSTFCGNGKYGNTVGKSPFTSFKYPNAIAIDNAGNLYVINGDRKDALITKIDSNSHSSIFINPAQKNLVYGRLYDLVFDSKNNLYVSDSGKNKIHKFDSQGNVLEFDLPLTFKEPAGLAVDKDDNLLICDSYNNRIVKVLKNNKTQIITANNGITLNEPESITLDKLGNIYVTDSNRTRIIKISQSLNSEIFLAESTLGKNKDHNLNEYMNTLKIEALDNDIFVFDKYDNLIIKLN